MEPKIRTMIVDDEPLARERIRALLESEPDIAVVAEAGDGTAGLEKIRQLRPDLVFLDIQMPGMDGLELLEKLPEEQRPVVVFVTAYDQFALKAFEVHALDYLLKPFDVDRFAAALQRARGWLRTRTTAGLDHRIAALLAEMRPVPSKTSDRIAVKSSGKVVLLKVADVDWVESADNYVNLRVGSESHLLRETMNVLEGRLPANQFVRISRSVIVNLDRVKELQPLFHGEYAVLLKDGTRLTLSRSYREKLDVLLGRSGD